jgi:ABC-type polysaccharide/polyol phosphate transport system ATPase subunit
MEDNIAIRISGLSKKYNLSQKKVGISLGERVKEFFTPKRTLKSDDFYALKDISLVIKKGESVGIIGRNGAGKSTLLKILAEVVEPSEGKVEINGTIASVLEIGMGFHPELTGRENVYLSGRMLGIPKKVIENKIDEIVDFSGVEKFIDTPVKHYSSGMYVRLAFSVVANIDADILLFDEVLNVGDSEFQQVCLKKILELTSSNKTVILVSHNMNDILHLCNRVFYIEKGKLDYDGGANASVSNYLQSFEKAIDTPLNASINKTTLEKINHSIAGKGLRIIDLCLFQNGETVSKAIDFHMPFVISIELEKLNTEFQINFSYNLIHHGNVFLSSNSLFAKNGQMILKDTGTYLLTMAFPECLLNRSVYQVDMYISCDETDETFQIKSVLEFSVLDLAERPEHKLFKIFNKFPGPLDSSLEWILVKHNNEN